MPPMPTAPPAPPDAVTGPTLVYDGECSFCTALSALAVWFGLVAPARRRPYSDFDGAMAIRLWDSGIRDELIVFDPATDQLTGGAAAIVRLLHGSRAAPIARWLDHSLVRVALDLPYRLVAYNRRAIAPPVPGGIRCACDPTDHVGYRWAFTTLVAAATWLAAGAVPLAAVVLLAAATRRLGSTDMRARGPAHVSAAGALGGAVFAPLEWIAGPAVATAAGVVVAAVHLRRSARWLQWW